MTLYDGLYEQTKSEIRQKLSSMTEDKAGVAAFINETVDILAEMERSATDQQFATAIRTATMEAISEWTGDSQDNVTKCNEALVRRSRRRRKQSRRFS